MLSKLSAISETLASVLLPAYRFYDPRFDTACRRSYKFWCAMGEEWMLCSFFWTSQVGATVCKVLDLFLYSSSPF